MIVVGFFPSVSQVFRTCKHDQCFSLAASQGVKLNKPRQNSHQYTASLILLSSCWSCEELNLSFFVCFSGQQLLPQLSFSKLELDSAGHTVKTHVVYYYLYKTNSTGPPSAQLSLMWFK